jgi:2-alkyl-3-oxoalkanoate reductase
MKIAIIGANGFVGSRLVETLQLAQEHAVVPVVRTPASLVRATRFDLEWRIADACDGTALREALRGCDAVVHAASGRGRDVERMAAALCTAAAAAGIRRVVYLSDASVHGLTPEAGSNEHSPLHTINAPPAIVHRIVAERLFFQRCQRLQLEGIALRPTLVYGPRSSWFAALAHDLREGRAWWFGDGRGIFNGLYVDNLVSAIFSSLSAPAPATGKPYLIGDAETATWRELYLATAKLLGVSSRRIASITEVPAEIADARAPLRRFAGSAGVKAVAPVLPSGVKRLAKFILAGDAAVADAWTPRPIPGPVVTREWALRQQCRWRFPHQRATRALGFQPTVSLAEGLKRTLAWLAFAEGDLSAKALSEPAAASAPLPTLP